MKILTNITSMLRYVNGEHYKIELTINLQK